MLAIMAWHATYNMEPSILDLQSCSVVFFKVLFQAGGGSRREDEDSGEALLDRIDIERDEPAGLVRACPTTSSACWRSTLRISVKPPGPAMYPVHSGIILSSLS